MDVDYLYINTVRTDCCVRLERVRPNGISGMYREHRLVDVTLFFLEWTSTASHPHSERRPRRTTYTVTAAYVF